MPEMTFINQSSVMMTETKETTTEYTTEYVDDMINKIQATLDYWISIRNQMVQLGVQFQPQIQEPIVGP